MTTNKLNILLKKEGVTTTSGFFDGDGWLTTVRGGEDAVLGMGKGKTYSRAMRDAVRDLKRRRKELAKSDKA